MLNSNAEDVKGRQKTDKDKWHRKKVFFTKRYHVVEEWSSLALLRINIQQHKFFCYSTQKMWKQAGEAFLSLLNLNGQYSRSCTTSHCNMKTWLDQGSFHTIAQFGEVFIWGWSIPLAVSQRRVWHLTPQVTWSWSVPPALWKPGQNLLSLL